jgi:hypothetical protein
MSATIAVPLPERAERAIWEGQARAVEARRTARSERSERARTEHLDEHAWGSGIPLLFFSFSLNHPAYGGPS